MLRRLRVGGNETRSFISLTFSFPESFGSVRRLGYAAFFRCAKAPCEPFGYILIRR